MEDHHQERLFCCPFNQLSLTACSEAQLIFLFLQRVITTTFYKGLIMFKHTLLLASALLAFNASADFYDPQSTFLKRDLPNGAYDGTTALNNYLNAVVTQAYTGETPASFNLSKWKQLNGFNSGNPLHAQYFNSGDLGLGRDMNCVAQPQLEATRGTGAMACYVSNFGKIGGGAAHAFAELERATSPTNPSKEFATVAMEYHPNAVRNKVRFFVFDTQSNGGKLVTNLKIALDNSNGQEQPGLCIACHGGTLTNPNDANLINITNAHFLPFDSFSFEFASAEKREAARPVLDQMNKLVHRAEKATYGQGSAANKQIWEYLEGSYTPAITNANPTMVDTFTPAPFNSSDNDRNLYHTVTKNYCRSCHMSSDVVLDPSLMVNTCIDGDMPHAEVNAANLRRHMEYVAHDMERYSGNTNCYKMPHLIDFQSALQANSMMFEDVHLGHNNLDLQTLLSGGEIFTLNGINSQTITTVDSITGVNNRRSVLKSKALNSTQGFVLAKMDDFSRAPKINKVELLTHRTGSSGNDLTLYARNSAKNIVLTRTVSNGQSTPGTSDSFLKFTENLSSANVNNLSFMMRSNRISYNNGHYQFPGTFEVDDISVSYDAKIPGAIYQDFENSQQVIPFNAARLYERLVDCSPLSGSIAGLGNQLKTEGDAGRYSYHTNTKLCKGDDIHIFIARSYGALLEVPSGVSGQLMFDFKISDKLTPIGPSFLGQAAQQGTLYKKDGYSFGRVKLSISGEVSLRFLVQEESGINGAKIHGLAIDNMRFIPNN